MFVLVDDTSTVLAFPVRVGGTNAEPGYFFSLRYHSQVIQKSVSLKYEPSSEPLHISARYLFLNRSVQVPMSLECAGTASHFC